MNKFKESYRAKYLASKKLCLEREAVTKGGTARWPSASDTSKMFLVNSKEGSQIPLLGGRSERRGLYW